jgi:ribosome biogenesis protein ENP2
MVLTVTESNDVKIYNLTNNKTLSEFFQQYKKNEKKMKKDKEFANRVDFIQNFEFPHASTKVEVSADGQYIIAAGLYGPQIKIFETGQLSLKCMRGLDSEIIDFVIMDTDYKKIAMICADRNIELHAQYGKHYKTRVPKTPRCIFYNQYSCDLLVGCSSNEIYRLNLEEGKINRKISCKF